MNGSHLMIHTGRSLSLSLCLSVSLSLSVCKIISVLTQHVGFSWDVSSVSGSSKGSFAFLSVGHGHTGIGLQRSLLKNVQSIFSWWDPNLMLAKCGCIFMSSLFFTFRLNEYAL